MHKWQYHNPVKIHFGHGIIKNLQGLVGSHNAVLITTPGSSKRGITDLLRQLLGNSLVAVFDEVQPNPTFISVRAAVNNLKQFEYDNIIALGGGSTIDTAKAVAAISVTGIDNWLEDHLKSAALFPKPFKPKPIVAIPTTAGTGSDVTMWATIWDMKEKKKYSLSHPLLYPVKSFLDPELSLTLPEKETIYSGLDALSHAVESIWNKNHNPVSDTFALTAISLIYKHLAELKSDLTNLDLRTQILRASLFAGLAFSNTKTALAHSISYPLTARCGIPHGLACALPLPYILKFYKAQMLQAENKTRTKLTDNITEKQLTSFFSVLGVPLTLKDCKISKSELDNVISDCLTSERANNYIFEMSIEGVHKIVIDMYG